MVDWLTVYLATAIPAVIGLATVFAHRYLAKNYAPRAVAQSLKSGTIREAITETLTDSIDKVPPEAIERLVSKVPLARLSHDFIANVTQDEVNSMMDKLLAAIPQTLPTEFVSRVTPETWRTLTDVVTKSLTGWMNEERQKFEKWLTEGVKAGGPTVPAQALGGLAQMFGMGKKQVGLLGWLLPLAARSGMLDKILGPMGFHLTRSNGPGQGWGSPAIDAPWSNVP